MPPPFRPDGPPGIPPFNLRPKPPPPPNNYRPRELIALPSDEHLLRGGDLGKREGDMRMVNNMPVKRMAIDGSSSGNNCSLEIHEIPLHLNNIAALNAHFFKYGNIVNVQVRRRHSPRPNSRNPPSLSHFCFFKVEFSRKCSTKWNFYVTFVQYATSEQNIKWNLHSRWLIDWLIDQRTHWSPFIFCAGKFAQFLRRFLQVRYNGSPGSALVTFQTPDAANRAFNSSEPVLNNRFIKIDWHNPNRSAAPVRTVILSSVFSNRPLHPLISLFLGRYPHFTLGLNPFPFSTGGIAHLHNQSGSRFCLRSCTTPTSAYHGRAARASSSCRGGIKWHKRANYK